MNHIYNVAGHRFAFDSVLAEEIRRLDAFLPFVSEDTVADFVFSDASESLVPELSKIQHRFEYEDVKGCFGRWDGGYMMSLCPATHSALFLWVKDSSNEVFLSGNYEIYLFRFALWIGFGLMTCLKKTLAIHSSCVVYEGKAVLFLGESGTGKSTHTRLWRESIPGSFLLNDDSPIIKEEAGKIVVYGSPWSGKTPCYRSESFELKACVRLSQAPYNSISRLSVLRSYAALHPSCPPQFAYDSCLYDGISATLDAILQSVPCYHLGCLPDKAAAELSCKTIFG